MTALFPMSRRAIMSDGTGVQWSSALLATGSTARRLDLPGADLDGVRLLRRLDDAARLRADLADGPRRVVVIGGGWPPTWSASAPARAPSSPRTPG